MAEQLNLACYKAETVDVTSADAAAKSKGELARLQKKFDSSQKRTAIAGCAVKVLNTAVDGLTARVSKIQS